MQYKINTSIEVRYLAINRTTGISDLKLTPTNPSGVDGSQVTFTEIGGGLYKATFTPNALGWWWARVSSVLHPEDVSAKSYYVGTTDDPNPTQEDGKVTSLDTKFGEVQATPTQYTLLGRLKDLWDKLNDLFTNGTAKLKIWDGITQANVTSDNKLKVETYPASGANGSVIIKDGTGSNYLAKVDAQNRLYVYVPPSQTNTTIQIQYDGSITPVAALQWNDMINYTVPTGYDLNCIQFDASDSVNNGKARAVTKINFGTFILSTNTYTDGSTYTLPRFASKLTALITTQVGGTNSTITITYTNCKGVTGRTATAILKSNSVGERIEFSLQSGDVGVIDVTNVSCSFVEAGAITIEGSISLFHSILTTSGTQYSSIAPLSSIVVPQGEIVYLQYNPSNGAAAIRRASIIGSLVQR